MSGACVVVVGSVNMDLVVRCERLPRPGETVTGQGFHSWPGGKGANQAVAAARLGAAVHFIGCVGDDAFGSAAAEALRREGIAIANLHVLAGQQTGVAMISVDAAGQNTIALASGANAGLALAHVDAAADVIASAAMLVCQLESPLAAVERAIAIAHRAGVPVLLNPAPASRLAPALLAQVDVLVPNEGEAAALLGTPQPPARTAERLAALGPRTVIVTLGQRGVQVAHGGATWHAPAPQVSASDTTGAGDTFVGALAVALSEGQALRDAVAFAQRAAAISVTREGAMPSMPRRAELAAQAPAAPP